MNKLYAKTLLYAYPNILLVCEQMDELVEKKAYSSRVNYMPAEEQCNSILVLIAQKDILHKCYLVVDKLLEKFSEEEIIDIEYKYFKRKPKEFFEGYNFSDRAYFRRQNKIIEKLCLYLENRKYNDKWFEDEVLSVNFMKELLRRVKEQELLSRKNKTMAEKNVNKNAELKLKNVKPVIKKSIANLTVLEDVVKEA